MADPPPAVEPSVMPNVRNPAENRLLAVLPEIERERVYPPA
ncbi:MAG: hypothetical protein ACRD1P_12735 [Thermoanaerobaculia bacterium]